MHPDQPAGVLAVGAGLRAEARGVRGVGQREVLQRQGLLGVQVGQRHLGGRDQEQLPVGHPGLEQVLLELGQLPGAGHRVPVDQRRHRELGVPVRSGVQVQEVPGDGPLQGGAAPAQHREPRPGQLGGPREVQDAQPLAEIDVVERGEVERRRLAPAADQPGVVVGGAVRDVVAGQVGDAEQQLLQLGLRRPVLLLGGGGDALQLAGPLDQRRPLVGVGALHRGGHPLGLGPRLVARAGSPRCATDSSFSSAEVSRA